MYKDEIQPFLTPLVSAFLWGLLSDVAMWGRSEFGPSQLEIRDFYSS